MRLVVFGFLACVSIGCGRAHMPTGVQSGWKTSRTDNAHIRFELSSKLVCEQPPDGSTQIGIPTSKQSLAEWWYFDDLSGCVGDPRASIVRSVNSKLRKLGKAGQSLRVAAPRWAFFGPTAYYAWQERNGGEVMERGLALVGPVVVNLNLYLSASWAGRRKEPLEASIIGVLSSMRPDSPPELERGARALGMKPCRLSGTGVMCYIPGGFRATVTPSGGAVLSCVDEPEFRLSLSRPVTLASADGDLRLQAARRAVWQSPSGGHSRGEDSPAHVRWTFYGGSAYYAWERRERGIEVLQGELLVGDRALDMELRFRNSRTPKERMDRYYLFAVLRTMLPCPD